MPLRRILPLDSVLFFNIGICARLYHWNRFLPLIGVHRMLSVGILFMGVKIILSLFDVKFSWIFGSFAIPLLIAGMIGTLSLLKNNSQQFSYAFPVYILHSLVMQILSVWLKNIFDKQSDYICQYIMLYIMTFLSCIFVAGCIKRISYKFYGLLFGGR